MSSATTLSMAQEAAHALCWMHASPVAPPQSAPQSLSEAASALAPLPSAAATMSDASSGGVLRSLQVSVRAPPPAPAQELGGHEREEAEAEEEQAAAAMAGHFGAEGRAAATKAAAEPLPRRSLRHSNRARAVSEPSMALSALLTLTQRRQARLTSSAGLSSGSDDDAAMDTDDAEHALPRAESDATLLAGASMLADVCQRARSNSVAVLERRFTREAMPVMVMSGKIGSYSAEQRRQLLDKFLRKREKRIWRKRVKYNVRKNFADSRLRVKGRFVRKEDEEQLRELLALAF